MKLVVDTGTPLEIDVLPNRGRTVTDTFLNGDQIFHGAPLARESSNVRSNSCSGFCKVRRADHPERGNILHPKADRRTTAFIDERSPLSAAPKLH